MGTDAQEEDSVPFQADGHRVERQGAEEVAAHALLDLGEGAGGGIDPVDGQILRQAVEFGGEVEVADELRRAGVDEEQVFKQAAQGAKEIDGLFLAVGAGAVAFSGVEELGIVGIAEGGAQQDEGILAAGQVDGRGRW